MSTVTNPVTRGNFLERVDGGDAPVSIDGRLVALTDPHGAAAEAYRILLYRLRQARVATQNGGGSVIAVTSAVRGEGVSLSAANLALTAARTGETRVALVDCDLRRGSLGGLLG